MQYSTREISAAHTLLQLRAAVLRNSTADGIPKSRYLGEDTDSSDDELLDSSERYLGKNNALSDLAIVTCTFIFVIYTLGFLLGTGGG